MNKKLFAFIMLYSIFFTTFTTFAASNYNYTPLNNNNANSKLQGYALFVPAGVTCEGVLSQEINSKSAVIGQSINVILMEDFLYNGQLIAPSGSTIMGSIVQNKKAGFGDRNAKMQIRFTTIRTPYNNIIPISATIATKDGTGVLRGGTALDTTKDYMKNTAAGAASGAVLGTAMGALSGGSVGRGAVYGTAVGAGIGVLNKVKDRGDEIVIPANSVINLFFDQPITVNAQ